jgi:hypothetical protein
MAIFDDGYQQAIIDAARPNLSDKPPHRIHGNALAPAMKSRGKKT